MNFNDVIKKRRSVRAYKSMQIPEHIIHDLLQAAISAPSAGNLQAYEMYIVSELQTRQQLAAAAWRQDFIIEAPISIVFCADPRASSSKYGKRGRELYCIQDATIAATYLQLAATDHGLATVWVGAFDENEVKKIMNLPPHLKPVAIIPVGYANEEPPTAPRRPFNDIVHK